VVADHLSRLKNEEVTMEEPEVREEFPDEFLLQVSYPNFVRGPLLDDMRPLFGPCKVLDTHH